MTNTYIITGKSSGHLEVAYTDELLNSIKLEFKPPLNVSSYEKLISGLPYTETELTTWVNVTGLNCEKERSSNEKIALFCEYHMKFKNGQKYKATGIDGKRIKDFKVNEAILTTYYTSTNFLFTGEKDSAGRHCVMNFCMYYNQIIAEMNSAGKSKFPDYWSLEYENKLSQNDVYQYWAHLRGLGLEPKKDRVGKTLEWIKKV